MENPTSLTPAQCYAVALIQAIEDGNTQAIQELVIERPLTLKNALSSYLYKSIRQRKRNIEQNRIKYLR